MDRPRVFEVANEAKTDVRTAMAALRRLGVEVAGPTVRIDGDVAAQLRMSLGRPPTAATVPAPPADVPASKLPRPTAPRPPRPTERPTKRPKSRQQGILRPEHAEAVKALIPSLYAALESVGSGSLPDSPLVVFHDGEAHPHYGVRTLGGDSWRPPAGSGLSMNTLLDPLRALDRRYVAKGWTPPNVAIAIDVTRRRAWHGRSLAAVRKNETGHFDPVTLRALALASTGEAPRLARQAQLFAPSHVPFLRDGISSPGDRPEETFLLHEELLRLAVDSLDGDEQLDPTPVHINGLWTFARPVIMRRPDGSDRHVRAVWYRQGQVVWRMRTYAAGVGNDPKEVGERLVGTLPFVAVWDEDRPEQKLLAAVWALMAQGGVTESERDAGSQDGHAGALPHESLVVVRVKAGTDHAKAYRADEGVPGEARPAWSVRGHWRKQPYPSLGYDEAGDPVTKLIWIASYTKGDEAVGAVADDKVISIHA
jgi:hypothetical protein